MKELEQVLKIPLSTYSPGTHSVQKNGQLPMKQLTQYLKEATQFPLTGTVELIIILFLNNVSNILRFYSMNCYYIVKLYCS